MPASAEFENVYEDEARAAAYAKLGFPGTYYLAFRDLPELFERHAFGRRALDFGCGTGRSSRFLRECGFDVTGVDISSAMLRKATELDPSGDYRLVVDGSLADIGIRFGLILSAFTFDNIPTLEEREATLSDLRGLLLEDGCIVNIVSSPEMYVNEWASFSTRDYPENRNAESGDVVKIVMLDVSDRRPVDDIVCTEEDYRRMYDAAGLSMQEVLRPLATGEEEIDWKSETCIAPWNIYVLRPE